MTPKVTSTAIKDCDIRGRYPQEVNEVLFLHLGKTFGHQVMTAAHGDPAKATVVVGCDDRPSTQALKKSFLTGLPAHDLRITDLGVVPTPVVYWAKESLKTQAAAMITASHNPPEFNGLKVMTGNRPPTPGMIRALADERRGDEVTPPFRPEGITPWPGALAAYRSEVIERFDGQDIESRACRLSWTRGQAVSLAWPRRYSEH